MLSDLNMQLTVNKSLMLHFNNKIDEVKLSLSHREGIKSYCTTHS
jgi:hypothetical protein